MKVYEPDSNRWKRLWTMASLVLAGEAVFGLPFHVSRYFRPTYVEVFDISQTQLGILGSIYGIVATFSYLLGGGIADRFSPRSLLCVSLVITGLSGFYLATIPEFTELRLLFGFWGASTILLFWPALIKATRQWGSADQQGVAFGILDGGRGLFAAILATIAVFFFAVLLPDGGETATIEQRTRALQSTILLYTLACFLSALFVWLALPSKAYSDGAPSFARLLGSTNLPLVLKMPAIWLQAVIIIAAYCTFKGIDYYSQYAKDMWGWPEVDAAGLSALSSWMRPIAAVGAGLLADRRSSSWVVIGCFSLTSLAYVSFMIVDPGAGWTWLLWSNVFISCLGLFALRGIYFALMEESSVPMRMTGTAVGVISFLGYTPEIFMPLLGGWLIDDVQGGDLELGYQVLFGILLFASFTGIFATLMLRQYCRRADEEGAP